MAAASLVAAARADAQQTAAPKGGGTTVAPSRGMAFEAMITIAAAGAALFAICRSSRRN